MADKINFDKMMDSVIKTAQNIGETITNKSEEFIKDSGLQDFKDYYPFYSWPPLNLYQSEDECLIFEFGLPGFVKDDIELSFDSEYMYFSARLSNIYSTGDKIRSYKKKLKLSDIDKQKYYVPEERFNKNDYQLSMENGLLRIVFSPKDGKDLALKE